MYDRLTPEYYKRENNGITILFVSTMVGLIITLSVLIKISTPLRGVHIKGTEKHQVVYYEKKVYKLIPMKE